NVTVKDVDDFPPTVTITNDEPGTGNIAGGSITYTFTFSENVTGFTADDINVVNGSKGAFTAVNESHYTLVVTPDLVEGNIIVDVAAGVAFDGDSIPNPNIAAIQSVQPVDMLAPIAPTVDPLTTCDTTPVLTGTATVKTGETLTITVSGSTATYTVNPDASHHWTLDLGSTPTSGTLTPLTGSLAPPSDDNKYSITATVTDAAGNSTSATNELTINTMIGDANNNSLIGHSGDNTLIGYGGNDALEGMGGKDHLDGGAGNDTASYASSVTDVTASLATNMGTQGD